MIGITAKIWVHEDKVEDFERVALELEAAVNANEPDCLLYRMTRSRTEPFVYMNLEYYKDQAAIDRHTEADYFHKALGGFAGCVSREAVVEFYDSIG